MEQVASFHVPGQSWGSQGLQECQNLRGLKWHDTDLKLTSVATVSTTFIMRNLRELLWSQTAPTQLCHLMRGCIQEVFGKAGVVAKLVLPETKTLAVVEYQKPGEARHAFKSLAFKRFQSAPLFIEWAPKDIFSGIPTKSSLQVFRYLMQNSYRIIPSTILADCFRSI